MEAQLPPPPKKPPQDPTRVTIIIASYMLCSSMMLIVNKGAVRLFTCPSTLLFLQTAFSAVVIWFGGMWGMIKVDALEVGKIKAFWLVTLFFMFNIFTNVKALEYSNVETVIVFQTLTSLVIAWGDYKWLTGGMPSSKVILSLGVIVVGAVCYVSTDSEFRLDTYFWVVMYFVAKTIDMLYTKHIVDTVPMTSWGRSFYNNFLSMFPFLIVAVIQEKEKVVEYFYTGQFTTLTFVVVLLSCMIGIGISIVGFMIREAVSATSFSVVGNMNKILTIIVNYMLWDAHASNAGILSLLICLAGGAYYAKVR